MRDVLPDEVLQELAMQMRRAANEAPEGYEGYRGDEDTVTGGLGESLRRDVRGQITVQNTTYTWRTTLTKFRGRGPNAPEKRYGVDAVIEIEVIRDDGEMLAKKLIPMQAKNPWTGKDKKLADQAAQIANIPGGGMVVDYRRGGYSAVSASHVADAIGDPNRLVPQQHRPLGDVLADDFLRCTIGSRNVTYDATRELLYYVGTDGMLRAIPFVSKERIRTTVYLR